MATNLTKVTTKSVLVKGIPADLWALFKSRAAVVGDGTVKGLLMSAIRKEVAGERKG